MFLIHGTIISRGTESHPITFDGQDRANFFSLDSSPASASLDIEYSVIRNEQRFWHGSSNSFHLPNSQLVNLTSQSSIWFPESDVYIEYNTFVNASGFSVGHSDTDVHVRYRRACEVQSLSE